MFVIQTCQSSGQEERPSICGRSGGPHPGHHVARDSQNGDDCWVTAMLYHELRTVSEWIHIAVIAADDQLILGHVWNNDTVS
jgi:hypothetical protein